MPVSVAAEVTRLKFLEQNSAIFKQNEPPYVGSYDISHTLLFFHQMHKLIIEPGRAGKNYWRDLWRYHELFYFLAWRDILVRYKQTVIGFRSGNRQFSLIAANSGGFWRWNAGRLLRMLPPQAFAISVD